MYYPSIDNSWFYWKQLKIDQNEKFEFKIRRLNMTNNIGSTWSLRSGRSTATTYDWRCEIIQSNNFNSVFHIQHVVTCLFNILYRSNNIWAWFICCTCFCSFILTMSQFFLLEMSMQQTSWTENSMQSTCHCCKSTHMNWFVCTCVMFHWKNTNNI